MLVSMFVLGLGGHAIGDLHGSKGFGLNTILTYPRNGLMNY